MFTGGTIWIFHSHMMMRSRHYGDHPMIEDKTEVIQQAKAGVARCEPSLEYLGPKGKKNMGVCLRVPHV